MHDLAFLTPGTPVAAHKKRPARSRVERTAPALSAREEAFLSGVSASGQFTLERVQGMYAGVKRLRDKK